MGEMTCVAKVADIPAGKGRSVSASGKQLAVFNVGGKFYAIDDACTHAGAPLGEGELNGTTVTCPWHGATFDVTTGTVLSEPAGSDVKSYPVTVKGEDVVVEVQ